MSTETISPEAPIDQSAEMQPTVEDQLRAFNASVDEQHLPTLEALSQGVLLAREIKPLGDEEEGIYCDSTGHPIDPQLAHDVLQKVDPENWILEDNERNDAVEILSQKGRLAPRLFDKVRSEVAAQRQGDESAKEALDRYKKNLEASVALSDQLQAMKNETAEKPADSIVTEQEEITPKSRPENEAAKTPDTAHTKTKAPDQTKTPEAATVTRPATEKKPKYDGNYVTVVRKTHKDGSTHMYGVDKNGTTSLHPIGAEHLLADQGLAGQLLNRKQEQTRGEEKTVDDTPEQEEVKAKTTTPTKKGAKSDTEKTAEPKKGNATSSLDPETEAAMRRLEKALDLDFSDEAEPEEESHDGTADAHDAEIEAAMRRLEKALDLDFSDEAEPDAPKQRENEDLVIYDEEGKAWRDDGVALTDEELDQINKHAKQIREGMTDATRITDIVTVDERNHAHRPDGTFMPREDIAATIRNQKEIRDGLAARAKENQVYGSIPDGFAEKGGTEEIWMSMDNEERERVVDALLQEQAEREAAEAAAAEQHEAEQKRPKGLRGRIRHMMQAAAASIGTRAATFVNRYTDPEKGSHRRKRDGAIAGALVVAAAVGAYFAYRNGMFTFSGNSAELAGNKPHDVDGRHAALAEAAHKQLGGFNDGSKGAKAGERAHETVKMFKGDTVWHEGEEHLIRGGNKHPSLGQITEEMHRIMKQDGITEKEARDLLVGSKLKI